MTSWIEEDVFSDGATFYRRLLSELETVGTSLDVEVYIFSLDDFGRQVASQLIALAARGVRVRVLVDGVGSMNFIGSLETTFKHTSIQLRVYGPVWGLGLRRFFQNLNRRNHRKTWILDGHTAYVGGMNIALEYIEGKKNSKGIPVAWKDYGVRVVGEGVQTLEAAFNRAWIGRVKAFVKAVNLRFMNKPNGPDPAVILNDRYFMRAVNFIHLLTHFENAQKRLWLASAYLAPHPALIRKIIAAASRGVDVRLLLSEKSDVFFMPWIATIYFERLLKAGVRIYEYLPTFFHGKVRLVDNRATIGSTNLNYRSLLHDLEVDIEIEKAQSLQKLELSLDADFSASREVTLANLSPLPWYKKLIAAMFFRLRYWL